MKQLHKGKIFRKVRALVGVSALFLLLLGMTAQAAEKTPNWLADRSEWDSVTGYHLGKVAQTMSCPHKADDDYVIAVSINGSGLTPNKTYLKDNFKLRGATKQMSQKYKNQINQNKIIWETLTPPGLENYLVSRQVAKIKVNGKEFVLASPYRCPDGYAGYAYFRYYFSYCPSTEEIYYTGTSEHVWLGCAKGDLGINEYHPKEYTHNIYKYYIEPNKYTIAYNGNGSTSGSTASQNAIYDESLKLRNNGFKKTGYTFGEWNSKKDGSGTSYVPGKSVKNLTTKDGGKVTLYAQWEKVSYQLTVKPAGGTWSGKTTDQSFTLKYAATKSIVDPTRPGYAFSGWTLSGSGSSMNGKTFTMGSANATLTANWKANTYTIAFDGNGSTEGIMSSITATADVPVQLPANIFKRTTEQGDSLFLGWALVPEPEGRTPAFADQDTIDRNLSRNPGETVTLYAVWDDCPQIDASDRYFNLWWAQNGKITEEELLRTATAVDKEDQELVNRTKAEIEAAGLPGSLSLFDYNAAAFTCLTGDNTIPMTYQAVDSAGNTVYETVQVHVYDTAVIPMPEKYTRYINRKYYEKSYEEGGLHPNSIWRTDPEYKKTLEDALDNLDNDTPVQSYYFTHEEVEEAQEYITEHGIADTREPDALQRFFDRFMKKDKKK